MNLAVGFAQDYLINVCACCSSQKVEQEVAGGAAPAQGNGEEKFNSRTKYGAGWRLGNFLEGRFGGEFLALSNRVGIEESAIRVEERESTRNS